MCKQKITIIGVGKMGNALTEGLLHSGLILKENLVLSNRSEKKLERFKEMSIFTTLNNKNAVKDADLVILAVKPNVIKRVCQEIKSNLKQSALIVSIAAGVRIQSIKNWLDNQRRGVLRIMPNSPLQIGQGMSGWTASSEVTKEQKVAVQKILRNLGKEIYFDDENMLNQVTAISGSGPAYFFHIIECLLEAARKIGLNEEQARRLVYQTFGGSSDLLLQSGKTAKELQRAVTSKGGTTEAALEEFRKWGLKNAIMKGVLGAFKRSQELSKHNTSL